MKANAVETETREVEATLSKEEESFKKRYGDLRRHMQEKEQEYKIKFEQLQQQLDKAAKNELVLPKGEADIAAWARKYPDVAAIVEAIADKKASERSTDLDKRLKEIEELRTQAKKDKAEAELMSLHPDFTQIRSDDAFHDWAESQPKWVQDALYENVDDAKSVARVIDLYKADMGITKQKTTSSDKAAASSVNARSRNTPEADDSKAFFRESQVNKMSTKDYEKNADAIMEAIRSGKFVYDVTGRK
jgi:septum formation inhibitor MinC